MSAEFGGIGEVYDSMGTRGRGPAKATTGQLLAAVAAAQAEIELRLASEQCRRELAALRPPWWLRWRWLRQYVQRIRDSTPPQEDTAW